MAVSVSLPISNATIAALMTDLSVETYAKKTMKTSITETVDLDASATTNSVMATVQLTETFPAVKTNASPTVPTTRKTTRLAVPTVSHLLRSVKTSVQRDGSSAGMSVDKIQPTTRRTTGLVDLNVSWAPISAMDPAHWIGLSVATAASRTPPRTFSSGDPAALSVSATPTSARGSAHHTRTSLVERTYATQTTRTLKQPTKHVAQNVPRPPSPAMEYVKTTSSSVGHKHANRTQRII